MGSKIRTARLSWEVGIYTRGTLPLSLAWIEILLSLACIKILKLPYEKYIKITLDKFHQALPQEG